MRNVPYLLDLSASARPASLSSVVSLAFSLSLSLSLSVAENNSVELILYDIVARKEVQRLPHKAAVLTSLYVDHKGKKYIVVSTCDYVLTVWDTQSGPRAPPPQPSPLLRPPPPAVANPHVVRTRAVDWGGQADAQAVRACKPEHWLAARVVWMWPREGNVTGVDGVAVWEASGFAVVSNKPEPDAGPMMVAADSQMSLMWDPVLSLPSCPVPLLHLLVTFFCLCAPRPPASPHPLVCCTHLEYLLLPACASSRTPCAGVTMPALPLPWLLAGGSVC